MCRILNLVMFGMFILIQSCATMYNSGNQSMLITASDNGNHEVTISTPNGAYRTKLPTTVTASPSTFKNVEIRIDDSACLNPTTTIIGKNITSSFWANIFNGGWGFFIDPLTGAMWSYDTQTTVTVSKKLDCK